MTLDYEAIARRHDALPHAKTANLPATYERACTALATCNRLDECKDWADKAAALASYARQADDPTLENLAVRIKARAVHRCGELLQTFQNPGARTDKPRAGTGPRSQRSAAKDAGMSERQEKQAVRVANVPPDVFEAAVENEKPATIEALAEMGTHKRPKTQTPPGFQHATYAIGRLKEFAAFCADHPPAEISDVMYSHERQPTAAHARTVQTWLGNFLSLFPSSEVER